MAEDEEKSKEKKKCSKCGAPLEGFLFSTIGKLFGIKESSTPGICNKCEGEKGKAEEEEAEEEFEEEIDEEPEDEPDSDDEEDDEEEDDEEEEE